MQTKQNDQPVVQYIRPSMGKYDIKPKTDMFIGYYSVIHSALLKVEETVPEMPGVKSCSHKCPVCEQKFFVSRYRALTTEDNIQYRWPIYTSHYIKHGWYPSPEYVLALIQDIMSKDRLTSDEKTLYNILVEALNIDTTLSIIKNTNGGITLKRGFNSFDLSIDEYKSLIKKKL